MTKQQAIEAHTRLVESRRKLVASGQATETRLTTLDRDISVLGQAYNFLISDKARKALALE